MIRLLRFRRPQPDTIRSIRHWATELAVVVVGVLLALVLAEWSTERREQANAEIAVDAMNREVSYHVTGTLRRVAAARCMDEQLTTLAQALPTASLDELRSLSRANSSIGNSNFDHFYGVPTWLYSFVARDRAIRSGAFDRLDPEIADQYAKLYSQLETISFINQQERERADRLSIIAATGGLNENERYQLLATVVELDALNDSVLNSIGFLYEEMRGIGLEPSEKDRADWQRWRTSLVETRGDCVLDLPLTFSGDPLAMIR